MRRWLSLACLILAGPALAQVPSQKLNQTLSTLNQSKSQEARLKQQLERSAQDLATMRKRATALASSLQQSEREAGRAERTLATLNKELSDKEKEFSTRKAEYARTVMGLLRMQTIPPTAMFADPETLQHMMQASNIMRHTNAALAQRAEALQQDLKQLTALRRTVDRKKQTVSQTQAALQEKQEQLAADLATRQRLQAQLSRDHATAQAQISKLSRESASLQELIGKLEKTRNVPQLASKPLTPQALARPASGSLHLPVAGTVVHRYGDRKNANETYRGMELSVRQGATVVAPLGGEVVFTGPFMNYGRMVLLKHGDGYITLLAGLSQISVALNQRLGKGEPLGTSTPTLYIEVRQRSKPIDPAPWFANLPSRVASR